MGFFLHNVPTGGTKKGAPLYQGLSEKGEISIYLLALFIGESKRYIKKTPLEMGNSLHKGPTGELGGGLI